MPVPSDFASRTLRCSYVDGSQLLRIYRPPPGTTVTPIHYGTSALNRFDCPAAIVAASSAFGVTYAAFDLATCFAETVTRERNRDPWTRGGIVVNEAAEVRTRYVASLLSTTRLRVADMTDIGLYGVGAEAGEFNSIDYPNSTQPWAAELHARPELVDGLLYRSRFLNGRRAVAIFERGGARVGLIPGKVDRLDQHPDYPTTLSELGVVLI